MRGSEVLQELRRMIGVAGAVGPAVAARAGLSSSELEALEHLMAEPLGPVEIAKRLHVTSAASSGIVDRLERRGHVVREPHPDDRRRTRVVVTPSGRAEVVAHLVPMFTGLAEAEEALSAHDREVVAAFLRRATDAITALL
ncbi:MarR family winged helix-turn-helix transcriptional regulator [Cellulomonas marina]|nr:MarR family transcriptional regulator [Cellulomonas marina]